MRTKHKLTLLLLLLSCDKLAAQAPQILPDSLYLFLGDTYPTGKLSIRDGNDEEVKLAPGNYSQQTRFAEAIQFRVDENGLLTGQLSKDTYKPEYWELVAFKNSKITSVKSYWYKNNKVARKQEVVITDSIVYTETKDDAENLLSKSYYYITNPSEEVSTYYYENGVIKNKNDKINKIKTGYDTSGAISQSETIINGEEIEKNYVDGKLKTLYKRNIYPSQYFERYDDNEVLEYKETYASDERVTTRIYYANGKTVKKEVSQYLGENETVARFKESVYDENNRLTGTKIVEYPHINPGK